MTLALLILSIIITAILVAGAWVSERLLRPTRVATRFVWVAAMSVAIALVVMAPFRVGMPTTIASAVLPAITVDAASASAAAQRFLPVWTEGALRGAWLVTSLVALLVGVAALRRHRAVLTRSVARTIDARHVLVHEDFGPAVIGLLRPQVVVPRWLLSRRPDEQSLVVAHERAHIAARDPLLLVAGAIPLIVMPWNPLFWWAFRRLRLAIELDCDARVLRAGAPALAYGSLLLDLTSSLPPVRLGAPAFAARPSQLEERILAMSSRPLTPNRRRTALVAASLIAGIALVAACSAEVSDTIVTADGREAVQAASGGPLALDKPYFDFQVEKPVQPIPGSGVPRYPSILRSAGVEGEVLTQFVVDTLGRVEVASFKSIRTSHDLFEASVRAALPEMRFTPAEVGGKKVRQLVQQPFVFALAK